MDLYHFVNLMFKPGPCSVELIEEEGNGYLGAGTNIYQIAFLTAGIHFENLFRSPVKEMGKTAYIKVHTALKKFEATALYRTDGKFLFYVAADARQ